MDLDEPVRRWGRELRKGSTRLVVLTAISRGETYGYEVLQRLRSADTTVGASEATVYPLLRELEADGFLEGRWYHNGSGPGRKYYRLSKDGVKLLSRLHTEWERFHEEITKVLKHA